MREESGCDIIFGIQRESKLDQIFGMGDNNGSSSVACKVLIHGISDKYDLEYAHKQVIKLKQNISPEYKNGTVMNLKDNTCNSGSKNDNIELAFGKPWNFTEIKDKPENEMDTIEIESVRMKVLLIFYADYVV